MRSTLKHIPSLDRQLMATLNFDKWREILPPGKWWRNESWKISCYFVTRDLVQWLCDGWSETVGNCAIVSSDSLHCWCPNLMPPEPETPRAKRNLFSLLFFYLHFLALLTVGEVYKSVLWIVIMTLMMSASLFKSNLENQINSPVVKAGTNLTIR